MQPGFLVRVLPREAQVDRNLVIIVSTLTLALMAVINVFWLLRAERITVAAPDDFLVGVGGKPRCAQM